MNRRQLNDESSPSDDRSARDHDLEVTTIERRSAVVPRSASLRRRAARRRSGSGGLKEAMVSALLSVAGWVTQRETYRARPGASARRSSGPTGTGAGGRDSEAIPDRASRDAGRRGRRGVGGGGRVLALEPSRGAVDTHGLGAKRRPYTE